MAETEIIKGLFVKKPHEKAPQFIKGKISIKRDEFINWLQTQEDQWINIDIKESRNGDYYAQIDTWKPEKKNEHPTIGNDGKVQNNEPSIEYPDDEIDASQIPF